MGEFISCSSFVVMLTRVRDLHAPCRWIPALTRWYSQGEPELPELAQAREFTQKGHITSAISELDRADQVCQSLGQDHPITSLALKQRYFTLQSSSSSSHRAQRIPVLQKLLNLPAEPSESLLAWKQIFHDELLISEQEKKAQETLQLLQEVNNSDLESIAQLRYQIGQSRQARKSQQKISGDILHQDFLSSISPHLRMEGYCEKGDAHIDTDPVEALKMYKMALEANKQCKKDDGESSQQKALELAYQALSIRRARSFIMAYRNDRDEFYNEEFHQEISQALKSSREGLSRYWTELVAVMALMLHIKTNFTLAEGMYRKCIELMGHKTLPQLPLANQHRILAEVKQSYKLLATSMQQDTLAANLDKETEELTLRMDPTLSQILPYNLVPLPIEEELVTYRFLG